MATVAEQLVEAEAAYHDLMVGRSAVKMHDSNGEEVTFVAAKRSDLYKYIQDLKALINPSGRTTGPAGFIF